MLRDITLGQFFPGDTVVHRLDPRSKLIMTVLYIAALFIANRPAAYILMGVLLIGMIAISRINVKTILRGLRPILIIVLFTTALNMFFTRGEIIFELWFINVTREGLFMAISMTLRLVMLISGTFMLTYTTSPIALTDGIESLMKPLAKLRFPVHELSMIMSIALPFIPTLIEETDKIMSAQKARGANFETGSLLKRAKALLPVMIPLFISAFRRADELADAMESRCYHGGDGRTRMKQLKMETRDTLALIIGAATVAAVVLLNRLT